MFYSTEVILAEVIGDSKLVLFSSSKEGSFHRTIPTTFSRLLP